MMSMSRPGRRALALVASISLSRLYVRSGMGLSSPRNNSTPLGTCRDGLADYRSSFTVMKARRIAATTMGAPCGRAGPRLPEARVVFHVHRMKPISRVFCRPHCHLLPVQQSGNELHPFIHLVTLLPGHFALLA